MTQALHTPGPWRLNAGNEIEIMDTSRAVARAVCGGLSGIRLREAEANARIIAAAPDLLEALQWALDELNGRTRYDEDVAEQQVENCYRLAEAAIAKARGAA